MSAKVEVLKHIMDKAYTKAHGLKYYIDNTTTVGGDLHEEVMDYLDLMMEFMKEVVKP